MLLADRLLLHGCNVMALDVRGTGSSGGSWVPFGLTEQYDIAYVVDSWIPAQSWSDQRVGMREPPYCGIIQLFAAGRIERDPETGEPAHLKALIASTAISMTSVRRCSPGRRNPQRVGYR